MWAGGRNLIDAAAGQLDEAASRRPIVAGLSGNHPGQQGARQWTAAGDYRSGTGQGGMGQAA
jgi:hypothetical protein